MEDTVSARRAPDESAGPVRTGPLVRFLLLFALLFAGLHWLLSTTGPVRPLGRAVAALTRLQASAGAALLHAAGQKVTVLGDLLTGGGFTCSVGEGCNGMSAVVLVLAGLLAFPAPWPRRLAGLALLVPAVLVVNVVRIAGLYWTGAHHPALFDLAHVYVGQVAVIAVTAALWWIWLSWTSRAPAASS